MKATVRFYSIKTGELLRSKLVNVKLEGNRTVFDTPITIAPGEDINIQLHFTNPILRSADPNAPMSEAIKASAIALSRNIIEVGLHFDPKNYDHPLHPINSVRPWLPFAGKNIVRCVSCGDSEVSNEDLEEWANACSPPICPCCRGSAQIISLAEA